MHRLIEKLLCTLGIHDKVIVDPPRVRDEFESVLKDVQDLNHKYTSHLPHDKQPKTTSLIYEISYKTHAIVCIRDACAYNKNFRALGLERLKSLKIALVNALEEHKEYEEKAKERINIENRVEAERKVIAAKKFDNLKREKGTLSFGAVDGSLSISDTANLSVYHKERDK